MRHAAAKTTLAAVFCSTLALQAGCSTTTEDIHRWGYTKQGPTKLVAVLTHDKYSTELRTEAAMTLIGMKPRGGRPVGITCSEADCRGAIEALASLNAEQRAPIMQQLIPRLIAEMAKPPSQVAPDQPALDTTYPFKDGAYALLTYADQDLIGDEKLKQDVRAALTAWVMADFASRFDNTTQLSSMQQVLRTLGAPGVRGLPSLLVPGGRRIKETAELIAELGDAETKLAASRALVKIAEDVESESWRAQKRPQVEAINKSQGLTGLTEAQVAGQVAVFQEEELIRTIQSMKQVGQKPIVDYLLAYAAREDPNGELTTRRAHALASLQGNLDKSDPAQIEVVLKLAEAPTTPDAIRTVAIQRISEMPRKLVIDRLYAMFKHDNWKVRWLAADLVLRMSDQSQLDEFMTQLSRSDRGMSLSEPVVYGLRIGELKGSEKPEVLADKYSASSYAASVRLSALSYYSKYGTKEQLARVAPYESDGARVPRCTADDCEWVCEVKVGDQAEAKEIATVGDFVRHCVKPAMEARTEADKAKEAAEKKAQEAKDAPPGGSGEDAK